MPHELTLHLDPSLWLFVAPRRRVESFVVNYDGTSSWLHVVESVGVPRTEIGDIAAHDATLVITASSRPQPTPTSPPRFLLDVHLGALARRLRLLGVDTSYGVDATDDALVDAAVREQRVLLSKDRGLLMRRAVVAGGYVRGDAADEQVPDVLDRFAPPLRPWTRCTVCNGPLAPVDKAGVQNQLEPGTRRSYDVFAQCADCGRVYWRGAHYRRLQAFVSRFA